ncbi:MAG: undecaprenyl-diphosphate phosphatase [Limnochordia bacterium]
MSLFHALVLGVVQGLTEFLPVSSSGHLVIAQHLFGISEGVLAFDIAVHMGTLLAVLIALRDDVALVLAGLRPGHDPQARSGRRLIWLLVIGTVPAVVVGLLFSDIITGFFSSIAVTGVMLLVTGTLLFASERAKTDARRLRSFRTSDAFVIGCGQALAVMPGLSRSGTTISAGLARGVVGEDAARFSFLLAIPVILGAAVLELPATLKAGTGPSPSVLAAGVLTSAVTGYLAIAMLQRFIRQGRLRVFAYYTWVVGALVLLMAYVGI